jgi:hypothetical protein
MPAAVRDGIGNVSDRTGHEWQSSWFAPIACLLLKLGQQSNLEIIKVVVVSRQLPAATVFHLDFNDVPVLIIVEAVPRDRGSNGCD